MLLPFMVWLSTAPASAPAEILITPRGDCPSAAAVQQEVRTLLGSEPTEPLRAKIDVQGPVDAVEVRLEYDAGGRRWTRELQGASCEAVLRAAALVIAVGLDPLRVHEQVEPALLRPKRPQAPPQPPPVLPPTTGEVEAPALPQDTQPEPRPYREPQETSPRASREASLRVSALVLGGGAVGLTPRLAGHLGGGAALGGESWRVELLAAHQFGRRVRHDASPSAGAEVSRTTGRPSACWTPQRGAFILGLCAGVEVGAVVGRGFGLDQRGTARALWAGLTPGARAMWQPKGPISFGLQLDVPISLRRPEFEIDDFDAPLFQVGAAGAVGSLAVEFTFFDETRRRRR